jgi:hypothetical protein
MAQCYRSLNVETFNANKAFDPVPGWEPDFLLWYTLFECGHEPAAVLAFWQHITAHCVIATGEPLVLGAVPNHYLTRWAFSYITIYEAMGVSWWIPARSADGLVLQLRDATGMFLPSKIPSFAGYHRYLSPTRVADPQWYELSVGLSSPLHKDHLAVNRQALEDDYETLLREEWQFAAEERRHLANEGLHPQEIKRFGQKLCSIALDKRYMATGDLDKTRWNILITYHTPWPRIYRYVKYLDEFKTLHNTAKWLGLLDHHLPAKTLVEYWEGCIPNTVSRRGLVLTNDLDRHPAFVFAMFVCVSSGLLEARFRRHPFVRLLKIATQLPIDLQGVLAQRICGSMKDTVVLDDLSLKLILAS